MHKLLVGGLAAVLVGCVSGPSTSDDNAPDPAAPSHSGFVDMRWDEKDGRLFLHIDRFDTPFIYQVSLARGIGSNDLGADRGRLGDTKLVEFYRSGNRVLLIENNTDYRADSDNDDERRAVQESFARSVLWGFTVSGTHDDAVVVDATDFFLRDALAMGRWLEGMEQGSFSVDNARSAIYLPRTKAFADNTEVEAVLTLTGKPKGDILATVVPDPAAITVHTHHSFVRLPDDGYEPLAFDPRSGYLDPAYIGGYADYAVPIDEPISRAFTRRHRLEKKDPTAEVSEAVEPIVYYLDRGAPEPVRGALLDGARWWNEAFEAAGYRNAYRVEMLPPDADPLDVRYNVIQWVHRSTRGWSYGASIADPRTGEIIKGHVSLGSLRVRQDYLLAEGLLAPYNGAARNSAMAEFALARIRQLSAHEVGHTLGLEHNFAGSADQRSSVMDYPFPLVRLDDDGRVDLSDAYDSGIGEWDKRAILWGYQDFPPGTDERAARERILKETYDTGLRFVADVHARSVGSAHAVGSLWDNGADAAAELERLMRLREKVLQQFSPANVSAGRPLAMLEEVLVPMYLLHRFQIQAAGKLIGGGSFSYDLKDDWQTGFEETPDAHQRRALVALLATLEPSALTLPDALVAAISPRPPGHARGRETFARQTGDLFDRFAPADAAIRLTLDVLLNPERAARLAEVDVLAPQRLGLGDVLQALVEKGFEAPRLGGDQGEIQRRLATQVVERLSALALDGDAADAVRARAWSTLTDLEKRLEDARPSRDALWRAHHRYLAAQIERTLDAEESLPVIRRPEAPPGSPIGQ